MLLCGAVVKVREMLMKGAGNKNCDVGRESRGMVMERMKISVK